MSDFLSKLERFFVKIRSSHVFDEAGFNFGLRRIVVWGAPVVGLALLCFFYWEGLWKHAEGIRNLALVAAATVGLPIAAWRSYTAHRQAETAQHSLLDERYQSAAKMLGGGLAVRLASIHALDRMARCHLSHHVLIMSAFSAVVRTSAKRSKVPSMVPMHEMPEDVTVIMEALAARGPEQMLMEERENYELDLRATDLRGLPMDKVVLPQATLDDAVFSDFMNQAVLLMADFEDASLVGASLDAAILHVVNLNSADLTSATLTNATLIGAQLRQAILENTDFSNAKLYNVDIEGAILTETDLTNVIGLTQQQLNSAQIDLARPPVLDGAIDSDTGEPLVVPV